MIGRENSIFSKPTARGCVCPGRGGYPQPKSSTSSPNDEKGARRFQNISPLGCRQFLSSLRLYRTQGPGDGAGDPSGRRRPRRLPMYGAREGALGRQDTLAGTSGSCAVSSLATEARAERGLNPILPFAFVARYLG